MQVVNGYVCTNCTDVANAKRGVDPAHPKDPPPEVAKAREAKSGHGPAVTLAGAFAGISGSGSATRGPQLQRVDITA